MVSCIYIWKELMFYFPAFDVLLIYLKPSHSEHLLVVKNLFFNTLRSHFMKEVCDFEIPLS